VGERIYQAGFFCELCLFDAVEDSFFAALYANDTARFVNALVRDGV
jgi:hypothetical protein